jgi:hypothetical protein
MKSLLWNHVVEVSSLSGMVMSTCIDFAESQVVLVPARIRLNTWIVLYRQKNDYLNGKSEWLDDLLFPVGG